MAFSALFGGLTPALLTVGLGAAAATFFLMPPPGSFRVADIGNVIEIGLFCLMGSAISLLIEKLRIEQQRAEQTAAAASEQAEWLRVTLASIGDAVVATDCQQRVTFVNPGFERLAGCTEAEAVGQPLDQIYHVIIEKTRQPAKSPVARALREGVRIEQTNELLILAKDGRERAVDDNAAPIKDRSGKLTGAILIVRDVTERRQEARLHSATAERLRLALEGGRLGVWEWNLLTAQVIWSEQLEQLYKLKPGSFGGTLKAFEELVFPEDLEFVRRSVAQALGRCNDYEIEFRNLWPDGSIRWLATKGKVFCDDAGRPVRMMGVVMDMTERRQAIEALQASERRFSSVVNHAPAGIFMKDRQGRYLMVNRIFEQNSGLPSSQIIGKRDEELFPLELVRLFTLKDGEVFDSNQACQFEVSFEHAGAKQAFLVVEFPLPDNAGQPAAVCGIATDISDRKRMEEALRQSEEEYRILAEGMPLYVFLMSPQGQVEYCNIRWQRWSGLTPEQAMPELVLDLIHPDARKEVRMRWQEGLKSGIPFQVECQMRGAAETAYRWYLTRATPLREPDGNVAKWVAVTLDIDDSRRAEETIRMLLERSKQLNAALQEADRHKDAFLATLAHELRNPLAPIRNALQVLRLTPNDSQRAEQARSIMERQLQQMVRLVDDLLDVSRISRNKLELRKARIELFQMLKSAVETVQPLIDAMGHTLTVALPPAPVYLYADLLRLSQVFANLLTNAAKYTKSGGKIELLAEQHGSALVVSVKDNGFGIAPENLPRLFDMFADFSSSPGQLRSGLGIGLSLARRLVEMHDGRIEAHSAGVGQGSEFIVRLPLLGESQPAEAVSAESAGSLEARSLRILVVDDNRDAADSLAVVLETYGHTAHRAYDGLEAVEEASKFQPDVVILDIGMPKMNGYEAAKRIRQSLKRGQLLLIALTGWGQKEDKRRAMEAGFDYHLTKPVDFAALEKVLADFCAERKRTAVPA